MNDFLEIYHSKDFKIAKENLTSFLSKHPELYQALFIRGEEIEYSGDLLSIFKSFGLTESYKSKWKTKFLVNYYKDTFFVTDSFLLPEIDRVFPISDDESIYLASQIDVNSLDTVLDIGTGSGIYAILCAKQARYVLAIDINPKAISYAIFNAKLNGVRDNIEFVEMDIRKDTINQKFSFVISNPAIIPAPKNSNFYIHSDGGIRGTNMSYEILNNMSNLLVANGQLKMLCSSFSNNLDNLDLVNFIKKTYQKSDYQFNVTELYTPSLNDLSNLFNNYKANLNLTELYNQTSLSLHYLFLDISHNKNFLIKFKDLETKFYHSVYNGSWEARLNRLFLVYKNMHKVHKQKI